MAQLLELEERPVRVTADGRWLHGDAPIHPKVAALFERCIVPEPEGGYHLQVGRSRGPLTVEDAAFFVRALRLTEDAAGRLVGAELTVSDGAVEALDAGHLMTGPDHAFYTRVVRHGLAVPCRFPPALYHQLAPWIDAVAGGFVLRLGGRAHPIRAYAPDPIPAGPAPGMV